MADQSKEKSRLILGWQMNTMLEPRYWAGDDPKLGEQQIDDLVTVSSETIASHTGVIAQSGSGKSFFLGRLIEEILLQTKARCLILDPNADFRKVHETEDEGLWRDAKYNRQKRRGKLPHEKSRDEFEQQWSAVRSAIRIKTGGGSGLSGPNYETLQLSWSSLSVEFLAEEIDPMLRSDLYHCHTFAQDLEILFRLSGYVTGSVPDNLIAEAEKLFRQARLSEGDFRSDLEETFNVEKFMGAIFTRTPDDLFKQGSLFYDVTTLFGFSPPPPIQYFPQTLKQTLVEAYKDLLRSRIRYVIERILKAPKYVSEVVGHFYFSKAREYQMAGILRTQVEKKPVTVAASDRLEVIDLPSLKNKATALLAINTILSMEWERARHEWSEALEQPLARDSRSPTFIVVDEAHNLIPKETRGKAEYALREQFRTIVAEGRKYGLFLILVSQRPDKLDPLVLSECENKAVMKLSSESVLTITREMLGLDDVPAKLLDKTIDFETGRVLLAGRWATDPQLLYCAARRTVEGGRNLRDDYWASPPEPPPEQSTEKPTKTKRSVKARKATKRARKSKAK